MPKFIDYFVIGRMGKYGNSRFGFRRGNFHIGWFAKDFLNEAEKAYGKFEFFSLTAFVDESTNKISLCGKFVNEDGDNAISLKRLFGDDKTLETFLLDVWAIWNTTEFFNRSEKLTGKKNLAYEVNLSIAAYFAEIKQ